MKKKTRLKLEAKKMAPLEISGYFSKADEVFNKNPKLANDYVRKARNLAMRFRLRLPRGLKRKFCKHCNSFLKPGVNCRVRTRNRMITYYCLNCRRCTKIGIGKRRKKLE